MYFFAKKITCYTHVMAIINIPPTLPIFEVRSEQTRKQEALNNNH